MEVHFQTGNYMHLNLFIRAATATMSDDFLKIGYNGATVWAFSTIASATLSAVQKSSYGLKNYNNAHTVLMNIHSVMGWALIS